MSENPSLFPDRRKVMVGMAATGVALTAHSRVNSAPKEKGGAIRKTQKTYVLVHGAWHGGWCWRDVAAPLLDAGHIVFTPSLTGLAERKHLLSPEIGLGTHIADIASLIEYYDLQNIILVGHSYGGMVITGLADNLKNRISHIVYLDAALPKNGDTMISQGPPRNEAEIKEAEVGLRALASDGIAMQAFPPEILGIAQSHPSYSWVAEKLTPHPLKTWLDPIKLLNGGSDGLNRTYIHCNSPALPNSSFQWHAQQLEKDESWRYHALATGHDAMITAPEKLITILEQATTV
ncbi:MAG: alpha/beta hydrolase family protein [Parasphingorhabdus sp.]